MQHFPQNEEEKIIGYLLAKRIVQQLGLDLSETGEDQVDDSGPPAQRLGSLEVFQAQFLTDASVG